MTDDGDFVFGGDSVDIPPGTYPATLVALGVKESAAFGEFRTWDFKLESGTIVGGASSMSTGSKSKGGRWGRALVGHEPKKGEKATLTGRPCLVVIGLDKGDWPTVTDVLPPLAVTVPAPVSPQAPATPAVNVPMEADSDELPF